MWFAEGMPLDLFNILGPLVGILALGAALHRLKIVPEDFFRQSNQLVYRVALPCLLWAKTATLQLQLGIALHVVAVAATAVLACFILSVAVSRLLKLPSGDRAAFIQGAFRGNISHIGLPVLFAMLESMRFPSQLKGLVLLTFAPLVPLHNIIAIAVLSRHQSASHSPLAALAFTLRRTATNPLFLACVLGILTSLIPWPVPYALHHTAALAGRIALPLALLSVGASLRLTNMGKDTHTAIIATLIKVIAAPIIALVACHWMQLDADYHWIVVVLLACPTAIASYIMAEQMGANAALARNIIVLTTLASFPILALLLLWLL